MKTTQWEENQKTTRDLLIHYNYSVNHEGLVFENITGSPSWNLLFYIWYLRVEYTGATFTFSIWDKYGDYDKEQRLNRITKAKKPEEIVDFIIKNYENIKNMLLN